LNLFSRNLLGTLAHFLLCLTLSAESLELRFTTSEVWFDLLYCSRS